MLIDTHAHIDMLENPKEAIKEAGFAGVKKIVLPAADFRDFDRIIKICEENENVFALLGVHPEYCEEFNDDVARKIIELANHKKVVGIGEIGLDYHYSKENKDAQKRMFETQLQIAQDLKLPVAIHDREAHKDCFDIIKKYKLTNVLFHCFSGSVEFMQQICSQGYKIAIGGVVTFKNAKEIKDVARLVKLEDLMLETDCPYLTPHPFRGMENSPKYVPFILKEIANLKNLPIEVVEKQTTINAQEFFNI